MIASHPLLALCIILGGRTKIKFKTNKISPQIMCTWLTVFSHGLTVFSRGLTVFSRGLTVFSHLLLPSTGVSI